MSRICPLWGNCGQHQFFAGLCACGASEVSQVPTSQAAPEACCSDAVLQAVADILAMAERVGVFSEENFHLAEAQDQREYKAYVKKRTGTNVEMKNTGQALLPILPYAPVYRPLFALRDAARGVALPAPSPEINRDRPWSVFTGEEPINESESL